MTAEERAAIRARAEAHTDIPYGLIPHRQTVERIAGDLLALDAELTRVEGVVESYMDALDGTVKDAVRFQEERARLREENARLQCEMAEEKRIATWRTANALGNLRERAAQVAAAWFGTSSLYPAAGESIASAIRALALTTPMGES